MMGRELELLMEPELKARELKGERRGEELGEKRGEKQGEKKLGDLIGRLFAEGLVDEVRKVAADESERQRMYEKYQMV